jgi:hypothetical protein
VFAAVRRACLHVSAEVGTVKAEAPRRAVTLGEVRSHREAIVRLAESFGIRNVRAVSDRSGTVWA